MTVEKQNTFNQNSASEPAAVVVTALIEPVSVNSKEKNHILKWLQNKEVRASFIATQRTRSTTI